MVEEIEMEQDKSALDPLFVRLVCNMLAMMDALYDDIQLLRTQPDASVNDDIRRKNEVMQVLYGQLEAIGVIEWKSQNQGFRLRIHADAPGVYFAILSARVVEMVQDAKIQDNP
jgi:hypothetical protein